jgi:hypothetical protein
MTEQGITTEKHQEKRIINEGEHFSASSRTQSPDANTINGAQLSHQILQWRPAAEGSSPGNLQQLSLIWSSSNRLESRRLECLSRHRGLQILMIEHSLRRIFLTPGQLLPWKHNSLRVDHKIQRTTEEKMLITEFLFSLIHQRATDSKSAPMSILRISERWHQSTRATTHSKKR